MASAGGFKKSYAVLIIGLMVLGVVAGAFYFYNAASQNPCGTPGPAHFGAGVYDTTVGTQPYKAIAANFTNTQQGFTFSGVNFITTSFSDPSQSHLVNGNCISDTFTPASITLQVTFASDQAQELLTINYGGSTQAPTSAFSNHSSPTAGVQWDGNPYITLLVSA